MMSHTWCSQRLVIGHVDGVTAMTNCTSGSSWSVQSIHPLFTLYMNCWRHNASSER